MKKCPFCAEEIQEEAIKCKHCGEFLFKKNGNNFGTCTDCGQPLEDDSSFCSKCGLLQIDDSSRIISADHYNQPKNGGGSKNFLWVIGILFLIFLFFSEINDTTTNNNAAKRNITSTNSNVSKPDYEFDLEERCKDWIFYRNRAYKLGREGDLKGSAKASKAMNQYYNDLKLHFSEQQITDEISRLEEAGYKAGF